MSIDAVARPVSVRKSVAWAFSGQFISFAVTFVGSIVMARLLSPGEMGVYAIATAVLGILQIVSAFGVGAYVVRETHLSGDILNSAFTLNTILAVLLSLMIFIAGFGGAWLFGDAGAERVTRLLALGPLIGVFTFRPAVMLQREMQFKAISIINVLNALSSALVMVIAAVLGASYMSLAYGALAAATVSAVAYNIAARASRRVSSVCPSPTGGP